MSTSEGMFTYQQGFLLVSALFMRVKHAIMPRKHLPYPHPTTQFLNVLLRTTFTTQEKAPFKSVNQLVGSNKFALEMHAMLVFKNGITTGLQGNGKVTRKYDNYSTIW